jgi:hypothetical protein
MQSILILITLLVSISSCGHLVNPAPPMVPTKSEQDVQLSCSEISDAIYEMQKEQIRTQKKIDAQRAQNILSGIGTWALIFPAVFIDVTTQKNDAKYSYEQREGYLRTVASDKKCDGLPVKIEQLTPEEQDQLVAIAKPPFVPSVGNIVQSSPTVVPPAYVTPEGYKVWEIVGKGMCEDNSCTPDKCPYFLVDLVYGDHYAINGKNYKAFETGKWRERQGLTTYVVQATESYKRLNYGLLGVRSHHGEKFTITVYGNLITKLRNANIYAPAGEYKYIVTGKGLGTGIEYAPAGLPVLLKDIFNGDQITVKGETFHMSNRGTFKNEYTWIAATIPAAPGISAGWNLRAPEGVKLEVTVKRNKTWTPYNIEEMFGKP